MKKALTLLLFLFIASASWSQIITTDPAFPIADQPVTITVDVSGTSLDHYAWNNTTSPVWIWSWISEGCSSNCDALTNVNPATSPAQDAAKCTRISTNPDKYQITFTPTTFFNAAASDLKKIGIKLKTKSWDDQKQTDVDKFIQLSTGGLLVSFSSPSTPYVFKNQNDKIDITANASMTSSLTLKINGEVVSTVIDATTISYQHTVTETSGTSIVEIESSTGTETKTSSFAYVVRSASQIAARPEGIVDGINYSDDHTKVTLSLYAPFKSTVYAMGDFNNWAPVQMANDNDHYWVELSDLTSGVEYAFQYLINETFATGDPYADKILDPDNDKYISSTTYPTLLSYPKNASGIVTVLQTGQAEYNWQTTGYVKPDRSGLTIYELLVRDFDTEQSYQSVINKLDYLKGLGINAIELMPIMEFSGNNSWGYNPIYYFAPDKAYGTKDKLKELIDKAHGQGIAVILDMVLNQADYECPLVKMYWDAAAKAPASNNPWFNQKATHPFSVFFDFNHESTNTQYFVDRITKYWLKEYRFDGYRFDLSKGFTQKNSGDNVGEWSAYDASRIALLERMADKIWEHTPDAWVILEHLSENQEEKELAEYKANEGKGMMPWGNMNYAYGQNAIGDASSSDISGVYYANRNWTVPNLVGYMESHDEERIMYFNLTKGNSSGGYSTKNIKTALSRMKATSVVFYTIPGPKMLWQFGEMGYDKAINLCEDGTIQDKCRTSPKPILWNYLDDADRASLKNHVTDMIRLRNTYDIFTHGTATFSGTSDLTKQVALKNSPYTDSPTNASDMNAHIAANFSLSVQPTTITFSHIGKWYEYFSGATLNVTSASTSVNIPAGQYKLYTDVKIENPSVVTGVESEIKNASIRLYPNPASNLVTVESDFGAIQNVAFFNSQGIKFKADKREENQWSVGNLPSGLYIAEVIVLGRKQHLKFIKD